MQWINLEITGKYTGKIKVSLNIELEEAEWTYLARDREKQRVSVIHRKPKCSRKYAETLAPEWQFYSVDLEVDLFQRV